MLGEPEAGENLITRQLRFEKSYPNGKKRTAAKFLADLPESVPRFIFRPDLSDRHLSL